MNAEKIYKISWCVLEKPYGEDEAKWVNKEAFRKTKGDAEDLSRKLYNNYHHLGFTAKLTVNIEAVDIL